MAMLYFKIIVFLLNFCTLNAVLNAQNIFDRFRLVNETSELDNSVKIASSKKVKRFDRLTVPLSGAGIAVGGGLLRAPLAHYGYAFLYPNWQAVSRLMGEGDATDVTGMITFQQLPYNNDIKVTINVTGLPVGKHALHIHTFGDLSEGCKSTGEHFPNNFLGNVDTKEDGSVSAAFMSIYLNLFGFNGIIGRSIVIHSKPIDLNTALNAEVFSTSMQVVPHALGYQNEENSVGPPIACGIISIMSNAVAPK